MQGERRLAFTGFDDDDGSADPGLAAALAARDHGATLQALTKARLLVPVVAMLGEIELDENGLAHDKSSDMAVALLRGQDGRNALLAFTSTESLARWSPDARPMPAQTQLVATAAIQEGAAAIVLDVAGPAPGVMETEDVQRLAAGLQVVRLEDGGYGWVQPAD
ncbi:type III secretion system (T3SS) SseB-like protein [Kribbella amoyensis]|uniref:Type III secretion system (T3SS) SseB-like protein n=1 Tax=Kribbella amoyensis TaxID=996641 RepID=A0A561B310_9ACTN|nr:SseB family protein [Kribbella amoyensis]TWD73245.1 type III secretion system (T3SS) SseB-like protein [Kribbella amoyensis]